MIAHIAGLPVEESLLPLMGGAGATLLLARVWLVAQVRRPGRPRHDRQDEL